MAGDWSRDALFTKARLYMDRALGEDRDDSLFPFWSLLAFELLARAALANVHPVLLADPREGENILHALGYGSDRIPKSIPATTVFRRCRRVVDGFTELDERISTQLSVVRNDELHSGSPTLEELNRTSWPVEFYRICQILLASMGLGLQDFLGTPDAEVAQRMLDEAEQEELGEVQREIAGARTGFESTGSAAVEEGAAEAKRLADRSRLAQLVACPACGNQAVRTGEEVGRGEPKTEDDGVLLRIVALATRFECPTCGLSLEGAGRLHLADLGGQFTVDEWVDPIEFFQISPDDVMADWEPDYGND